MDYFAGHKSQCPDCAYTAYVFLYVTKVMHGMYCKSSAAHIIIIHSDYVFQHVFVAMHLTEELTENIQTTT